MKCPVPYLCVLQKLKSSLTLPLLCDWQGQPCNLGFGKNDRGLFFLPDTSDLSVLGELNLLSGSEAAGWEQKIYLYIFIVWYHLEVTCFAERN